MTCPHSRTDGPGRGRRPKGQGKGYLKQVETSPKQQIAELDGLLLWERLCCGDGGHLCEVLYSRGPDQGNRLLRRKKVKV